MAWLTPPPISFPLNIDAIFAQPDQLPRGSASLGWTKYDNENAVSSL